MGGQFVLRIEDTDQERLVEGAVDVIYRTLDQVGLKHDEGPDVGGDYGPYVQSERKDLYKPYAEQLVKEGKAYYCFCTKERLDALHEAAGRAADTTAIAAIFPKKRWTGFWLPGRPMLSAKKCRWRAPPPSRTRCMATSRWKTSELEDQILLKADGYPTYNFANVIDDHQHAHHPCGARVRISVL